MAEEEKKLAVVDTENCSICAACEATCPQEAIKCGDDFAAVDAEKCDGCGTCAEDCPTEAITLQDRSSAPA